MRCHQTQISLPPHSSFWPNPKSRVYHPRSHSLTRHTRPRAEGSSAWVGGPRVASYWDYTSFFDPFDAKSGSHHPGIRAGCNQVGPSTESGHYRGDREAKCSHLRSWCPLLPGDAAQAAYSQPYALLERAWPAQHPYWTGKALDTPPAQARAGVCFFVFVST